LLEYFDTNGDGKVDSQEFLCAMAFLSNSNLDEKAELLFDLYDFDGSKYISKDELVILMTNSLTSLNKMDKKKPPTLVEIENKVDEFFEKADTNRDNKITLKEFKTYVKTDQEILKVLFNHDIAKNEDLGTNHGPGEIPEYDSDLDSEINPKELDRSDKLL
jgi:Ca2+-binding EF-hand superfamily protein